SLDWDEASIGWNAYSLLKTGTDEYGKAWPVSIRSFNDYKPPMYVYAAIPSIAVFGLNEFAVRLPSALAGILTVIITFFLVRELTKKESMALVSSLLLAISPWSIQFSRGAFEANLALFFFVLGAYFLLKWPFFSIFPFILSIYGYHSSRLVIPAFLFLYFIFNFKYVLKNWKIFTLSVVLFLLCLYPLIRNSLHTGAVTARLNSVTMVNSPAKYLNNYLSHYNFDFLFLNADNNGRHHAPGVGLLYLAEFPFLLAGFYFLIKNKPSWAKFILIWLAVAPMASALVNDAPHAIRSLMFLPVFQIIIAYGLTKMWLPLIFLNFLFWSHQYFVHFPVEYAKDWQYGYKEVVKKVLAVEKNYETIYVTNFYDQPYIYFLFYGRIDPIVKNSGYFYQGLDKYEFGRFKDNNDALYVLAPSELTTNYQVLDKVQFPDKTDAFVFATIKP
ncbi:MAG: glycosyltransferase family 39 protein, partial [bacterium]|nr:glycosyltransferase family 39 protein [bacterium]